MGLTVLEIEVGNPANPDITERIEFLIDSGAIYSVVPSGILAKLDIRPLAEQEFRLADGTKITRKKGTRTMRRFGKALACVRFAARNASAEP